MTMNGIINSVVGLTLLTLQRIPNLPTNPESPTTDVTEVTEVTEVTQPTSPQDHGIPTPFLSLTGEGLRPELEGLTAFRDLANPMTLEMDETRNPVIRVPVQIWDGKDHLGERLDVNYDNIRIEDINQFDLMIQEVIRLLYFTPCDLTGGGTNGEVMTYRDEKDLIEDLRESLAGAQTQEDAVRNINHIRNILFALKPAELEGDFRVEFVKRLGAIAMKYELIEDVMRGLQEMPEYRRVYQLFSMIKEQDAAMKEERTRSDDSKYSKSLLPTSTITTPEQPCARRLVSPAILFLGGEGLREGLEGMIAIRQLGNRMFVTGYNTATPRIMVPVQLRNGETLDVDYDNIRVQDLNEFEVMERERVRLLYFTKQDNGKTCRDQVQLIQDLQEMLKRGTTREDALRSVASINAIVTALTHGSELKDNMHLVEQLGRLAKHYGLLEDVMRGYDKCIIPQYKKLYHLFEAIKQQD